MIVKNLEVPIYLKKLEALFKRLSEQHPNEQMVKEELAKQTAGYNGVREIDYYLYFLPDQKYDIFYDVRLFNGRNYFQMDILILTQCFFLILEVKNMAGILLFDPDSDQLIRILNEKEDRYKNPILQVAHQKLQLKNWLNSHKIPLVPIETLVVFSNPRAILKTTNPNHQAIFEKVIHSENLLNKINTFEKRNSQPLLSEKDLRKLSRLLIKNHTPYDPDILQKYKVDKNDILTGVQCPNCSFLPMKRIHGNWRCPSCSHCSKDAHVAALRDYVQLFGTKITNQAAREFLQIESDSVAKRILHSLNLHSEGKLKERKYYLSSENLVK